MNELNQLNDWMIEPSIESIDGVSDLADLLTSTTPFIPFTPFFPRAWPRSLPSHSLAGIAASALHPGVSLCRPRSLNRVASSPPQPSARWTQASRVLRAVPGRGRGTGSRTARAGE